MSSVPFLSHSVPVVATVAVVAMLFSAPAALAGCPVGYFNLGGRCAPVICQPGKVKDAQGRCVIHLVIGGNRSCAPLNAAPGSKKFQTTIVGANICG